MLKAESDDESPYPALRARVRFSYADEAIGVGVSTSIPTCNAKPKSFVARRRANIGFP